MPLNIYHRGKWRLLKMIGKEIQQKETYENKNSLRIS